METLTEVSTPTRTETNPKKLRISDRLGLIGLIEEGVRTHSSESPLVSDLFDNLWHLVHKTVSGSKIDRLEPEQTQKGFRMIEINAATGENLGRLNMLYLKKPIPCYYLVYVEVAAPFRKKGLGNRILDHFRRFLAEKSALGLLDNIIPDDDPTYDIYSKQAWEPLEAVIGDALSKRHRNYMIHIPPRFQGRDLREPVLRLVHHLERKRTAIEMRDNELMVQRTIAEFKDLYHALLSYFETQIKNGEADPLMRFMFTRFVTKLISFRRRMGELIGYTGGESMEQITLAPAIAQMTLQSYAPAELATKPQSLCGDTSLLKRLPVALQEQPARFIESLPNYARPSLVGWLHRHALSPSDRLTIGNLMDLGFDPTRLKELAIDGEEFIIERIQARQLQDLEKKKDMLRCLSHILSGTRLRGARLRTNPPLLTIRDRGNAYVLRRKINGIHWEEALEQLQVAPSLKALNESIQADRKIRAGVRDAFALAARRLNLPHEEVLEHLTCFVSWDLKGNHPGFVVEPTGTFLESLWLA